MARVRISAISKQRTAQRAALPLVRRTTNQIEAGAQRLVPHGSHRSGSGRAAPGQPLSSSIKSSISVAAVRITGRVGSRKAYAATVHQGSRPHVIRGRGRMLRFRWERGDFLLRARGARGAAGRFFFFRSVRHPGNKRPVRYLTTPLIMFARANGFFALRQEVSRFRLP